MRRSTILCAPLLALALLAGCDQGDDPGDDAPTGTGAADGASGDGTERPERGTGGASCRVGSWEPADLSLYSVDSIESLGGTFAFTMTFDDGTVSIDVTSTVPATEYTEAMDMAVAVAGDYAVSGGTITVSDLTSSTTINGVDQSDTSELGFGSMEEGESGFSCDGDTLTLDGEEFSRK